MNQGCDKCRVLRGMLAEVGLMAVDMITVLRHIDSDEPYGEACWKAVMEKVERCADRINALHATVQAWDRGD